MALQYSHRVSRLRPRCSNEIRSYRVKAGLTQRRLGKAVGRSRTAVSAWERGVKLPSVPCLFALARALDTLAEALYHDLYRPKRREEDGQTPAR